MSNRSPSRPLRLLWMIVLLLLAPGAASAADGDAGTSETTKDSPKDYDEMTPMEVRLEAKRLNRAIQALDRTDVVAGYGFALRREARLMIGGGLGIVGGTFLISGLTLLGNQNAKAAPLITSVGMPLGLGVLTAGLPAMILAPRFLGWYATNGPAPSNLARLKLLHRWSLEELRVRRDTALISTGFFGAATALTMGVWASRDRLGANGTKGTASYDPGDGVMAMSFLAVTSASGAMGLIWAFSYRDEMLNKHRLYVMPTVSVGSVTGPSPLAEPGTPAPVTGTQISGAINVRF